MAERAVVLVVNRERILADLLVRSLEGDGLAMFGAASVTEAVRIFEQSKPDLVIIDPAVPDSFSFIERVRDGLKPPQVVALVDSSDPAEFEALSGLLARAGVERTADKAGGLELLVDAIRRALEPGLSLSIPGQQTRILIVDDEDGIRTTLGDFLASRGYAVFLAEDGQQAVEMVTRDPSIRLVLLDVSMPRMGGLEALRRMMATDPHPDVIMITAVADREIARRTLEAGAFDYILKPFDLQSIENSIVACISYADYHRQPWWKRLVRRSA